MVKLVGETVKGKPSEKEVSREKNESQEERKSDIARADTDAECHADSRGQCLRRAVASTERAEGECSATRCSKAN